MDPEYDPSHKTSSITSTTSTNSWDSVPSLTNSSVCNDESPAMNEQSMMDDYSCHVEPPSYTDLYNNDDTADHNQKSFSHFSDHSLALSGEINNPIVLHQHYEIATKKDTSQKSPSSVHTEAENKQPVIGASTTITNSNSNNGVGVVSDDCKFSRDLLTEDEKRANHIASEQKRRNTIRTGFKELTEIIPTLKNINNSKSTILFKAVEYIRHLDKCNRGLRDKLKSLQLRLEIDDRIGRLTRGPPHLSLQPRHCHYRSEHQSKRNRSNSQQQQLPPETLATLLLRQHQQRQLEMLQEQLRYQQELLAKYNISIADSAYPTRNHPRSSNNQSSSLSSSLYSSMSIPADRSSLSTTSHQHPSVYSQFHSSSSEPSHQHRSSTSALVMPNMTDRQSFISSSSTSSDSLLGISSLNIPADDDFDNNPTTSSKLHT